MIICHHITFRFYLIDFRLNYRFPFPILRFFYPQNHLALLKDRFLKKLLLKRAKTRRLFWFAKLYVQIILLL